MKNRQVQFSSTTSEGLYNTVHFYGFPIDYKDFKIFSWSANVQISGLNILPSMSNALVNFMPHTPGGYLTLLLVPTPRFFIVVAF